MTPEERFQRIENALATMAENQAKHDEDISELRRLHMSLVVAQLKTNEQLTVLTEGIGKLALSLGQMAGEMDEFRKAIERFLQGNNGTNGK